MSIRKSTNFAAVLVVFASLVISNEVGALQIPSQPPYSGTLVGNINDFQCLQNGYWPSGGCFYVGYGWTAAATGTARVTMSGQFSWRLGYKRQSSYAPDPCDYFRAGPSDGYILDYGFSFMDISTVQGQKYCLWVGGSNPGGASGDFTISYNFPAPPPPNPPPDDTSVPILPVWGIIIMSLALLTPMLMRGRNSGRRRW